MIMVCATQQLESGARTRLIRRHFCDGQGPETGNSRISIYTLHATEGGDASEANDPAEGITSCSSEHFSKILAAFCELRCASVRPEVSSGRGVTNLVTLEGSAQGIMRLYRRGGMLARFVAQTFVAAGELRPVRELAVLAHLRASSAAVPEPCAAVVCESVGGWFYEGALVTRYLPMAVNMLDVARELDSTQLVALGRLIGAEARSNLLLGVFQPDLHLGNVLLEPGSLSPTLIDFDKADWNQANPETMFKDASINSLIDRWHRSAQKHLPSAARELTEAFKQGIRGESQ